MLKAAILRRDAAAAAAYALSALGVGTESPTAAYALALACLAAGDDVAAAAVAERRWPRAAERSSARPRLSSRWPRTTSDAYASALSAVLADFEARDLHLTGVQIADTVLVLERLAEARGLAGHPVSRLLPPR